jgi:tRNA dimethylallyltransferase
VSPRAPHDDKTLLGRDRKKVPEKVKPARAKSVLILVGPTGVGKTEVGFHLAVLLGGEIISADSRLVYRGMDIGTAKPSTSMRDEVRHHLIDVADPDEEYTCKMFERDARQAVHDVLERGKIPVVVGGTGLYVRALTDGIFEGPGRDEALRASLEAEAQDKGKRQLWERLNSVDPEKARQIDPENLVRVIRALEVFELAGRPMSELEQEAQPLDVPYTKVGLTRGREELYRVIDRRVEAMLEAGLLEEVKDLIDRGYKDASALRDSLGYQEVLGYLDGSFAYAEAVSLMKRNTRRFAKRQMTWFKKEKDIAWMDITGRVDFAQIAHEISSL